MKDSVIIVSGGLDSITLLYDKAETIALAISFDYGQNHSKKELPYAEYHCQKLGIPHITIPLTFMHQYFKSSLLEGAEAIPEGHYEEENMKSTVVPFRNGIMLAIATGIAESHELKRVYIANHGGDHTIYPDCRPEFIDAMDKATSAGTFVDVRVEAPYTNISKTDIVRRGTALGIDYAKTWSCYKGSEIHCGKCGTCVERKEAFADAGVKDPTEYEN
ncbi:7-cyano-7-deazaguanine synthase QueC [Prevotella sp.]|uniref:7-cyano-7-deazaguanine synthase QueC n=1 Tax=Prevotella sp. TaxID=59823 RepID=UPI001CB4433A|nr:7-cyano-7-deazaguanine synthase QueC [Prevotella sp.]MBF1628577.1 7-cyano-7-deazaguanine synthase QueC [Prevotella sp.]